jgi:hypothetical protein
MKSNEWNTYRTRFLVKAKQLSSSLSFTDHLGRQHCGRKGDYLVESCDGVLSITPRQIFEDVYVPMICTEKVCDENTTAASPADPAKLAELKIETMPIGKNGTEKFRQPAASLRRTDPDPARVRRKRPQPVRPASPRVGLM